MPNIFGDSRKGQVAQCAGSAWLPMSDGHFDCITIQKSVLTKNQELRPRRSSIGLPGKYIQDAYRRPLKRIVNTGEKFPTPGKTFITRPPETTFVGKVSVTKFPSALRKINRHSAPPAIFSYAIVNQRISNIAASTTPRRPNGTPPPNQVAYKFVFTNVI